MSYLVKNAPPDAVNAGDRLTWYVGLGGLNTPPSDGYACTVYANGPASYSKAATVTSDGRFLVEWTPTDTAAWPAGFYRLTVVFSKAGERYALDPVNVTVRPNVATATGDQRTHAEKTLAAIESLIEGRIPNDVETYSVAGRSLTKMPMAELIRYRGIYRAQVVALRRGYLMPVTEVVFRAPQ